MSYVSYMSYATYIRYVSLNQQPSQYALYEYFMNDLTLIRLGFLNVFLSWGGGGRGGSI